jgi:hypothetical protein
MNGLIMHALIAWGLKVQGSNNKMILGPVLMTKLVLFVSSNLDGELKPLCAQEFHT